MGELNGSWIVSLIDFGVLWYGWVCSNNYSSFKKDLLIRLEKVFREICFYGIVWLNWRDTSVRRFFIKSFGSIRETNGSRICIVTFLWNINDRVQFLISLLLWIHSYRGIRPPRYLAIEYQYNSHSPLRPRETIDRLAMWLQLLTQIGPGYW